MPSAQDFKTYIETAAPADKKPAAITKAMQVPAISSSADFKAALQLAGWKRDADVGMIAVTFCTKSAVTVKRTFALATKLGKIAKKYDPNARVDDVGLTFKGKYYAYIILTNSLANRDAAIKKVLDRLEKACLAKGK